MTTRSSVRLLFTAGVLVASLALLGCPKRPEVIQAAPAPVGPSAAVAPAPAPTPPPAPPQVAETPVTQPPAPAEAPPPPPPAPPAPAAPVAPAPAPLKDVFFDFDKSGLLEDQKGVLNENVAWLKANPAVKITVEGHCDERGTAEYNLALGERRAKSVKDYLVAGGIAADRIAAISYGKERPFVLGHDESAWKWNRRGHIVVTAR
jgi:peptidoglycan-associated lipoprotein